MKRQSIGKRLHHLLTLCSYIRKGFNYNIVLTISVWRLLTLNMQHVINIIVRDSCLMRCLHCLQWSTLYRLRHELFLEKKSKIKEYMFLSIWRLFFYLKIILNNITNGQFIWRIQEQRMVVRRALPCTDYQYTPPERWPNVIIKWSVKEGN